ncbi:DoxX family membrane protein [Candidatus Woesearchaeota archaeon]|nr:DoxX family membrane protein [Candidatus Woesearchaeota archaeon]
MQNTGYKMIPENVVLVLRIIFGVYMAFAGFIKFFDLKGFARIVLTYRILPRWIAMPSSYSMPFVELAVGLLLISGWYGLYVSGIALLLVLTSLFFVSAMLIQGRRLESCGCLGTAIKIPVNWKKLVEVVIWLIIAISIFYSYF